MAKRVSKKSSLSPHKGKTSASVSSVEFGSRKQDPQMELKVKFKKSSLGRRKATSSFPIGDVVCPNTLSRMQSIAKAV